jgi:translation elongation factor aEF-1 beta
MGSVVTTFRVMPESAEVDLDGLEKRIKEKITPARMDRQPIAFGLSAILLVKQIPEKDGELERVTKEIESVDGVREAEVVSATRSM